MATSPKNVNTEASPRPDVAVGLGPAGIQPRRRPRRPGPPPPATSPPRPPAPARPPRPRQRRPAPLVSPRPGEARPEATSRRGPTRVCVSALDPVAVVVGVVDAHLQRHGHDAGQQRPPPHRRPVGHGRRPCPPAQGPPRRAGSGAAPRGPKGASPGFASDRATPDATASMLAATRCRDGGKLAQDGTTSWQWTCPAGRQFVAALAPAWDAGRCRRPHRPAPGPARPGSRLLDVLAPAWVVTGAGRRARTRRPAGGRRRRAGSGHQRQHRGAQRGGPDPRRRRQPRPWPPPSGPGRRPGPPPLAGLPAPQPHRRPVGRDPGAPDRDAARRPRRFRRRRVMAAAGPEVLVSLVPTALARIDGRPFYKVVLGGSAPPRGLPANVVTTYGHDRDGQRRRLRRPAPAGSRSIALRRRRDPPAWARCCCGPTGTGRSRSTRMAGWPPATPANFDDAGPAAGPRAAFGHGRHGRGKCMAGGGRAHPRPAPGRGRSGRVQPPRPGVGRARGGLRRAPRRRATRRRWASCARWCATSWPLSPPPRNCGRAPSLPKTSIGKLRRGELRRQLSLDRPWRGRRRSS